MWHGQHWEYSVLMTLHASHLTYMNNCEYYFLKANHILIPIRGYVRPSVCPPVRTSVRLSVPPSLRPFVRPFVCSSVRRIKVSPRKGIVTWLRLEEIRTIIIGGKRRVFDRMSEKCCCLHDLLNAAGIGDPLTLAKQFFSGCTLYRKYICIY